MKKIEKKLLSAYRQLNTHAQSSLIEFAEFLLSKNTDPVSDEDHFQELYRPEDPPENESVIAAIKRLQRSYKMLDTDSLFTESSRLMSLHMLQGQPANEVIRELESLFEKTYRSYLEGLSSEK